jgi:hypothetical protein
VYLDPNDPRLFVPRKKVWGWNLNFAHPRAPRIFAYLVGAVLLLQVIVSVLIGLATGHAVGACTALLYIVLSSAAALVVFCLNGAGARLGRQALEWLPYGLIAIGVGMLLQVIMNGGALLLLRMKQEQLTWTHHLYFGPMAGLCQTIGKLLALKVMARIYSGTSLATLLRMGLCVGLGFTLAEITLLGTGAIWQGSGPTELMIGMGVWERASASMFHVYAGGLVALGLATKRWWWLVFVVAVHGAMDWLAGSASSFQMALWQVEGLLTAVSMVTWLVFRVGSRSTTSPSHG